MRREGLEKALRSKLEEEVRKLKEETVCLKGEFFSLDVLSFCENMHHHASNWYLPNSMPSLPGGCAGSVCLLFVSFSRFCDNKNFKFHAV